MSLFGPVCSSRYYQIDLLRRANPIYLGLSNYPSQSAVEVISNDSSGSRIRVWRVDGLDTFTMIGDHASDQPLVVDDSMRYGVCENFFRLDRPRTYVVVGGVALAGYLLWKVLR